MAHLVLSTEPLHGLVRIVAVDTSAQLAAALDAAYPGGGCARMRVFHGAGDRVASLVLDVGRRWRKWRRVADGTWSCGPDSLEGLDRLEAVGSWIERRLRLYDSDEADAAADADQSDDDTGHPTGQSATWGGWAQLDVPALCRESWGRYALVGCEPMEGGGVVLTARHVKALAVLHFGPSRYFERALTPAEYSADAIAASREDELREGALSAMDAFRTDGRASRLLCARRRLVVAPDETLDPEDVEAVFALLFPDKRAMAATLLEDAGFRAAAFCSRVVGDAPERHLFCPKSMPCSAAAYWMGMPGMPGMPGMVVDGDGGGGGVDPDETRCVGSLEEVSRGGGKAAPVGVVTPPTVTFFQNALTETVMAEAADLTLLTEMRRVFELPGSGPRTPLGAAVQRAMGEHAVTEASAREARSLLAFACPAEEDDPAGVNPTAGTQGGTQGAAPSHPRYLHCPYACSTRVGGGRNSSHDLRAEPANPRAKISPWLNSTLASDGNVAWSS